MTGETTTEAVAGAAATPIFAVTAGNPSADDLAVITAVLLAVTSAGTPEPSRRPIAGTWADPTRAVRRTLRHGFGGWRAAAR